MGGKKMTKRFIGSVFFALLLFSFFGNPGYAYIDKNVAIVQIMNKAAGKTQTVRLPIGHTVEFEKLHLLAQTCKQTDPFEAENFYAFIEINKSDSTKVFSNWMNRNTPGATPVQNADYDVWLLNCE